MTLRYYVLTDNYFLKLGINHFKDRSPSLNKAIHVRHLRNNKDNLDGMIFPQDDFGNLVVVLIVEDVKLIGELISKLKSRSKKFLLLMNSNFFKSKTVCCKVNKNFLSIESDTFHVVKYQTIKNVDLNLTLREKHVLNLTFYGVKASELARLLSVSETTIYRIKERIIYKFGNISSTRGMQLCKLINEFC